MVGSSSIIEAIARPVFERGYKPAATHRAGGAVTGLDPGSYAFASGRRRAMRLVRCMIEWLPRDAGAQRFRRLSLTPSDDPAWATLFGRAADRGWIRMTAAAGEWI